MNITQIATLSQRVDGSYVINNEYHVPDNEEFAELYVQCAKYASEHPELVIHEPAPTPPTTADILTRLRHMRDARLVATDKYLLADYPISPAGLSAVRSYRTALRDLPDQPGAPWDGGGELTPWPELPSVE